MRSIVANHAKSKAKRQCNKSQVRNEKLISDFFQTIGEISAKYLQNYFKSLQKANTNPTSLLITNTLLYGTFNQLFSNHLHLLMNLVELELSNTNILIFPKEIGKLSALEYLKCHHTLIKTVPEEIGHCSRLIDVELTYNLIESLPKSIKKLSNLRTLNLFNNFLTASSIPWRALISLSSFINKYIEGHLEFIDFSFNKVLEKDIPSKFIEHLKSSSLTLQSFHTRLSSYFSLQKRYNPNNNNSSNNSTKNNKKEKKNKKNIDELPAKHIIPLSTTDQNLIDYFEGIKFYGVNRYGVILPSQIFPSNNFFYKFGSSLYRFL